jgi:hypothetical protein
VTVAGDLPDGVVDLYVHASPDLIERADDDVTLAKRLHCAGIRAAVHRHHFQSTATQCGLASQVTGFPLYGAIVCNTSVGGLNPAAVEVALRGGARWVGLPTLSAEHHQRAVSDVPPVARRGVEFAAAPLRLVDSSGLLLDEVRAVVELADRADVPVGVGYPSLLECVALLSAGRRSSAPFVLTNPIATMGLRPAEVELLLGLGNVVVEVTCYSLYRSSAVTGLEVAVRQMQEMARTGGRERMVLSSDSGITGAPPAPELFGWALSALVEHGAAERWLHPMVTSTPAELLGIA